MSLAADAGYGNGELLNWLEERNTTPYMYTREGHTRQNSKLYGIDHFTYVPETGNYICPEGKQLTYLGIHAGNRNHVWFSTPARCRDCSQKSQCTTGNLRRLSIHIHEAARQRSPGCCFILVFEGTRHLCRSEFRRLGPSWVDLGDDNMWSDCKLLHIC
jgi:hypothetical protein